MKDPTPTGKATSRRAAKRDASPEGWTDDERAAMRERAKELKASARGADGEADLLARIAEMPDADRSMAERIHAIVKSSAPELVSRTWYGMPAYAKDGKVVCFFQSAAKFKARYATLGFNDAAALDDGSMWPTAYALTELTTADEARVAELVRRAAG
ncbi:MAG: iron chaperone [Candidatus Limnocylindria bacterium]